MGFFINIYDLYTYYLQWERKVRIDTVFKPFKFSKKQVYQSIQRNRISLESLFLQGSSDILPSDRNETKRSRISLSTPRRVEGERVAQKLDYFCPRWKERGEVCVGIG